MFQEAALFPWLTVARNVELPLRLRGVPREGAPPPSGATARPRRPGRVRWPASARAVRRDAAAGGARPRAGQDADVLLMDEPFGALDAMTRDLLHDELERIWQQRQLTVVFVTHNVREAARLADRIMLLTSRPGRVASDVRRRHRPAAAHRIRRRRRPGRRDHRPSARGGGSPWPSLTPRLTTRSRELSGLDTLDQEEHGTPRSVVRRAWSAVWPKLAAILLFLTAWQLIVWSGWKPDYILPGPTTVLPRFVDELGQAETWRRSPPRCAGRRSASSLALVIGTLAGLTVSRSGGCCAQRSAR